MSNQLTNARVSAGLSLSQAAKLLGIERSTLVAIEADPDTAQDETVSKMSQLYQVSVTYLRTGIPASFMDDLAEHHDAPDAIVVDMLRKWAGKD